MGPPGAGKTTLARKISIHLDAIHIDVKQRLAALPDVHLPPTNKAIANVERILSVACRQEAEMVNRQIERVITRADSRHYDPDRQLTFILDGVWPLGCKVVI